MHGKERGAQYIDAVYLLGRDYAHGPCHGVTLYLLAQHVAFLLCKLLGVVQVFVVVVVWKDYSGGVYRTGKASASCLVATCLDKTFIIMVQEHLFN